MPRRANALAGESALQGHSDPLDKFTRHRRLNQPIARALYKDSDTIDVGRRIATCADVLGVDLYEDDQEGVEARLRAMRPCNARLCPFCEWRRTRAWRRRLFNGLEAYSESGEKRVPLFLTLTVPNPPMEDLRDTLGQMNKAWHRFTSHRGFPTDMWFRRTEVTVSQSVAHQGTFAHPPLPCLVAGQAQLLRQGIHRPQHLEEEMVSRYEGPGASHRRHQESLWKKAANKRVDNWLEHGNRREQERRSRGCQVHGKGNPAARDRIIPS